MPPMPPREAFESDLDVGLPRADRDRRRDLRWLFYALVLGRVENGPLSAPERKRLVRYGRELGIDAFEAELLVTGAEYRDANTPRLRLARSDADCRHIV